MSCGLGDSCALHLGDFSLALAQKALEFAIAPIGIGQAVFRQSQALAEFCAR